MPLDVTRIYNPADIDNSIERQPRWLSGNKGNMIPKRLIFFDTETIPVTTAKYTEKHNLDFGWACYIVRKSEGSYTKPEWLRFDGAGDFWDWVETKVYPKSKLHIYAHNLIFDSFVTQAFTNLTSREWTLTNPIIEDPPTVLKFEKRNPTRSIEMIDTLNYFPFSVKEIGKWVGLEKYDFDESKVDRATFDIYCKRDVEIIMKAMIAFHEFINSEDLGNVKITLASQAFSAYRHRFMNKRIFVSSNEIELSIARSSYTGGRSEAFFIGKIKGTVHCVDINAMYPYMMRVHPYPTEYDKVYFNPDTDHIKKLLKYRLVIADCLLDTEENSYPVHYDTRLVFPLGQFRTVLTTAELTHALENNRVKGIFAAVTYFKGRIFEEWVDYFWKKRQLSQKQGDKTGEMLYKLMMNSLYGKFGQRGFQWKDIGICPSDLMETELIWNEVTQESRKLRRFAGLIQEKIEKPESKDSIPSIAAHVTGYGRMYLQQLINQAGKHNVFYCDTDSLFINDQGLANLKQLIKPGVLGKLKLEWSSDDVEIHGLKDYRVGSLVKIKGIRRNAVKIDDNTYRQAMFQGFKGALKKGLVDQQMVYYVDKHLTREYKKGTVTATGAITPLVLNYSGSVTPGASIS